MAAYEQLPDDQAATDSCDFTAKAHTALRYSLAPAEMDTLATHPIIPPQWPLYGYNEETWMTCLVFQDGVLDPAYIPSEYAAAPPSSLNMSYSTPDSCSHLALSPPSAISTNASSPTHMLPQSDSINKRPYCGCIGNCCCDSRLLATDTRTPYATTTQPPPPPPPINDNSFKPVKASVASSSSLRGAKSLSTSTSFDDTDFLFPLDSSTSNSPTSTTTSSTDGGRARRCPHPGCSKKFVRESTLQTHLKSHTVPRPYVCSECSRSFARKHDAERHYRMHSNDRPYHCPNCTSTFPRSDALRRHWSTQPKCAQKAKEVARLEEAGKEGKAVKGHSPRAKKTKTKAAEVRSDPESEDRFDDDGTGDLSGLPKASPQISASTAKLGKRKKRKTDD